MKIITHDGTGGIVSETGEAETPLKSSYTRDQFIALIPKAKVRAIQSAVATDDDINVWVFNLPMLDVIDLNDLPGWFMDGMAAMVSAGIFTQNQINTFLEI